MWFCTEMASEVAESAPESTDPTPQVGRLNAASSIRRELARVYRDARQGRITPVCGTKLAYILSCLGKVVEAEEMTARLDALERRMEGRLDAHDVRRRLV